MRSKGKNILFDIRCNHKTGIFNYGLQLLRTISKSVDKKINIIVLCQKSQITDMWSVLRMCENISIVLCHLTPDTSSIERFIYENNVILYVTPNYQLDFKPKVPFIIGIHDLTKYSDPAFFSDSYEYEHFRYRMQKNVMESIYVLTNSYYSKSKICDEFEVDKGKVLIYTPKVKEIFTYEDFNHKLYELSSAKNKIDVPFFMYVGLMHHHKRIDFLVDAYLQAVPKMKQKCLFLIVSKDINTERFKEKYASNQYLDQIIGLSNIGDEELASLYHNALALCSASTIEGYGIPIAEALTCGCPVIASDIDVYHDEFGEELYYFSVEDKERLTNYFSEFSQNEIERKEWKQKRVDETFAITKWLEYHLSD